jgi:hypothetical protein
MDPGIAFRLVVKSDKYTARLDYVEHEMDEQEHELWVDGSSGYSHDRFIEDMTGKIIWGTSQALSVWVLDTETGSEWKLRRNEHFEQMMKDRWDQKVAYLVVEVVDKAGYSGVCTSAGSKADGESGGRCRSGVTNNDAASGPNQGQGEGIGDTYTSPQRVEPEIVVDWSTLTIIGEPEEDGEANGIADEDQVFEAMGFKEADASAYTDEVPIPTFLHIFAEEMNCAGLPVDDNDPAEPMLDSDRDNPDMSVGTIYPSMVDFRLAVRQHAIVTESELATEKTDRKRFRGHCKALGCPWIIRAKTQADNSVRV